MSSKNKATIGFALQGMPESTIEAAARLLNMDIVVIDAKDILVSKRFDRLAGKYVSMKITNNQKPIE